MPDASKAGGGKTPPERPEPPELPEPPEASREQLAVAVAAQQPRVGPVKLKGKAPEPLRETTAPRVGPEKLRVMARSTDDTTTS